MPIGAFKLNAISAAISTTSTSPSGYLLSLSMSGTEPNAGSVMVDNSENIFLMNGYAGTTYNKTAIVKTSESGSISWQNSFGKASTHAYYDAYTQLMPNGNIAICGTRQDVVNGSTYDGAFWQVVNASTGNTIFAGYTPQSSGRVVGKAVATDSSSNIYALCYNANQARFSIIKYSSTGSFVSENTFTKEGGSSPFSFGNFIGASNGNYIRFGIDNTIYTGSTSCRFILFDQNGSVKSVYGSGSTGATVYGMSVDSSGNTYVVFSSGLVVKFDVNGSVVWQKTLSGVDCYEVDSDGSNVYVGFRQLTSASTFLNCGVACLSGNTGTLLWQNMLGKAGYNLQNYRGTMQVKNSKIYFTIRDATATDQRLFVVPSDGTGTGSYGSYSYFPVNLITVSTPTYVTTSGSFYNYGSVLTRTAETPSSESPASSITKSTVSSTTGFSYSYVNFSESTQLSTITMPTGLQAGDVAIMFDTQNNSTTTVISPVTPSGWTNILDNTFSSTYYIRTMMHYKILTGSESGTTITGMAAGTLRGEKKIVVYRPSTGCAISVIYAACQTTASAPTNQVINMTSLQGPFIGLAWYFSTGAITTRGSTITPTRELGAGRGYLGTYEATTNSSSISSSTISMADYGYNTLANLVIKLTG